MKFIVCFCLLLSFTFCQQWFQLEKKFFQGFQEDELDDYQLNIPKNDIITQCGSHKLVGGFNKFSQQTRFYKTFHNIPAHSRIRVSFRLFQIDTWENNERSRVLIDGINVFFRNKPQNDVLTQLCGQAGFPQRDVLHEVTFVVAHNSPTLTIEFTENLDQLPNDESWGLSHLFIEYYGGCPNGMVINNVCIQNPPLNTQECSDNLGELMADDGSVLMSNVCEDFVDDQDNQAFKFLVQFDDPYQFSDQCLDIRVFFGSQELNRGDSFYNEWSYNASTQQILWNIKLEDFTDLYDCQWIEEQDQYTWLCDFKVNLYFMEVEQLNYSSKIRVTIDRNYSKVLEIDVQKNNVVGVCCENELNIQTQLRFCTNANCNQFLDSPLTIIRKSDFYVEQRITTPGFQSYFLKQLQVKIDDFFPVIVDSQSLPGRLILTIRSNIAKQNLSLQVISQLSKEQPTLLRRRALQQTDVGDDYRIINYEQISIISDLDVQDTDGNSINQDDQFNQVQNKKPIVNAEVLKVVIISASVVTFIVVALIVSCFIRRRHHMKKYEEKRKEKESSKDTEEQLQE